MTPMNRMIKSAAKAATTLFLCASFLAACGGGDSTPGATATVSGTAATGAAIAGGTVTFKCVAGTVAAVTTGTDGSFTADVGGATLPCVARVAYSDAGGAAQKLHTVFLTSGTANLTPLTDLILASLTRGAASSAFDNFTPDAGRGVTAAQITAAIAAVKTYLGTLGVSVVNLPADPVGTKFIAKAGTIDGDLVDKILDDLKAKLAAARKTLGDAETDINASSGSGNGSGSTGSVGCTGDAAALFAANAGSYSSTAQSYGGSGTVAGIANGATTTVTVSANCTLTVGDSTVSYKDGSYTSGGGEIGVSLESTNFDNSSYEFFGANNTLASLHDKRTNSFMNFAMSARQ